MQIAVGRRVPGISWKWKKAHISCRRKLGSDRYTENNGYIHVTPI